MKDPADKCLLTLVILSIFLNIYYLTDDLSLKLDYYRFAIHSSPETLRAFNTAYDETTVDYYYILKECQRLVPASKEISIVLSKQPTRKFQALTAKGRYILYPQNYGENSEMRDFVLVYGVEDFLIPSNYKILKSFGKNKYLLMKNFP